MARTFQTALINDLGPLEDIHPRRGKKNHFMGKLKQKLAIHWNERFRFECREVWDVFWEARRAFLLDGCLNLSASLAFYTTLSLLPFLLLLISGTAHFLGSSESGLMMALSLLSQLFPHGLFYFRGGRRYLPARRGDRLVGFLSMLWTASVIFSSLENAMGVVFRVEKRRNFLKGRLLALSMIPASALVFLLSFSVTSISSSFQEMETILWRIDLAKESFLEFLIGYPPLPDFNLGFTAVYKIFRICPVSFPHALAGGASCAFLFEVAKHFFSWFFKDYGRYGVTYGALEAMIILVLWTFYSACILLFCAEVISAYRRRDVTLLVHAFMKHSCSPPFNG
jgi:membrane protein